jgi:hypothetical protein
LLAQACGAMETFLRACERNDVDTVRTALGMPIIDVNGVAPDGSTGAQRARDGPTSRLPADALTR